MIKKLIYYLAFLLLLLIIKSLPVSALEINTCTRTNTDLKVRDSFIKENNRSAILKTPCVDASLKIYDFADLLTDNDEEKLQTEALDFISKTNYDLAVVTILDNENKTTMEYADDFYDYNDFGFNKTRDGVLILLDMMEREVYISTTGNAILLYDDERIQDIIDYGFSELEIEDYYQALTNMVNGLVDYYDLGYPDSNQNLLIDEFGNPYYVRYIPYSLVFILSSIFTLIISLVFYFKSRLKIKKGDVISYLKSKDITLQNDKLVNTIITHSPRNTSSNSSSSSSSGGGSSYHSSSSGSFHGGGGRHF